MDVLKVSSHSKPTAVAGALAGLLKEHGHVELQAIGAGAINQAVKAIAITRGYIAPIGLELTFTLLFLLDGFTNSFKTRLPIFRLREKENPK